jgi:hypothetical protein
MPRDERDFERTLKDVGRTLRNVGILKSILKNIAK